jgi:hypothetical protein
MPVSVRYRFTQVFAVPAQKAFEWCTDFHPSDNQLMGDCSAERQISHVADGVLILKDTFQTAGGMVEKQKLVHLYPDQLSWTSTHLTFTHKHSQFLYIITPEGKDASTLTFIGHHLEYDEKADAQQLSKRLCKEDADAWKLLAKAMEKNYTLKKK